MVYDLSNYKTISAKKVFFSSISSSKINPLQRNEEDRPSTGLHGKWPGEFWIELYNCLTTPIKTAG